MINIYIYIQIDKQIQIQIYRYIDIYHIYLYYIYYIYIYKLSLFGRDDTKEAKSLIFIVVPQVEQFPKVQKNNKKEETV